MTAAEFAQTIGEVESGNDPTAWGDLGLAMGRYQVHAAWLFDWAGRLKLSPRVDESWDLFVTRVVQGFFGLHPELTVGARAVYFHRGNQRTPDPKYLAAFLAAAQRLGF